MRYGVAEPWKRTAARIGRTKPSRVPHSSPHNTAKTRTKKNDGRPPDTRSALTSKHKRKQNILDRIANHLSESTKSTETRPQRTATTNLHPPISPGPSTSESDHSSPPELPHTTKAHPSDDDEPSDIHLWSDSRLVQGLDSHVEPKSECDLP